MSPLKELSFRHSLHLCDRPRWCRGAQANFIPFSASINRILLYLSLYWYNRNIYAHVSHNHLMYVNNDIYTKYIDLFLLFYLIQYKHQSDLRMCTTLFFSLPFRAPEGAQEDPIASGVLTTIFSMTAAQSEKVNGLGSMDTILNIYSECYLLQASACKAIYVDMLFDGRSCVELNYDMSMSCVFGILRIYDESSMLNDDMFSRYLRICMILYKEMYVPVLRSTWTCWSSPS